MTKKAEVKERGVLATAASSIKGMFALVDDTVNVSRKAVSLVDRSLDKATEGIENYKWD